MRADYRAINPDAIRGLASVGKHLDAIDASLRALLELRVSQINGCAYCVDKHANEAREAGESQQRLDCLTVWEESELFSDDECAALAWAEVLTGLADRYDTADSYASLMKYFSEEEIVDITLVVATMNAWNRIGVGFDFKPIYRE